MLVLNVPALILQRSLNESMFTTFGVVLSPGAVAVLWYVLEMAIVVSCQSLGALIGCFMVTPLLHTYGVKSALMLVNNILLLLGSFSMVH
ncbi:hypothetical protein COOONC_23991 [Cooperia oncophora]